MILDRLLAWIECHEVTNKVDQFLTCIEHYEVTNKVLYVGIFFWMLACGIFTPSLLFLLILQETNLHIDLRHFIGVLMKLPGQDKLKRRVIDIMAEWDPSQILLNDLSDYRWARTSPELCDSLVYVSMSKSHSERRYVLVHTVEVLIPRSLIRIALRMSPDAGLSIVYG